VKRRQALLGSNLPRDSRMQVALNNAAEGSSSDIDLSPSPSYSYYSSFPADALENPLK